MLQDKATMIMNVTTRCGCFVIVLGLGDDLTTSRFQSSAMIKTSGQTGSNIHAVLLHAQMYRPNQGMCSVMQ